MPAGGKIGNKGGGRKKLEEELKDYKEKIKQITLEELAESKIYGHLVNHTNEEDRQGLKEIALPVYLKSKADKVDHTTKGKPLSVGILNAICNNNSDNKDSSDGEENKSSTGGDISE